MAAKHNIWAIVVLIFVSAQASAQGFFTDQNGEYVNTVTTAVPMLRINPDARSGGMGDVGIGLSPDANSVYTNNAKLAFIGYDPTGTAEYAPDFGVSISFTPCT